MPLRMVAGRYDPPAAVAVGYIHGDPLEGVEGGRDGAAALTRFVNAAMGIYDPPLRSQLVDDLTEDGVLRLLHLRLGLVPRVDYLPGHPHRGLLPASYRYHWLLLAHRPQEAGGGRRPGNLPPLLGPQPVPLPRSGVVAYVH